MATAVNFEKAGGGGSGGANPHLFKQAGTSPFNLFYPQATYTGASLGTVNKAIDTIEAVIFVGRSGIIDGLSFEVTTLQAGQNSRLAIYKATSRSNLYPAGLLFDSGNISTATTGVKTAVPNLQLSDQDLYWLCYNTSAGAAAIRSINNMASAFPALGILSTMGGAPNVTGITVASAFGAYPAAFSGGAVAQAGGIAPVLFGVHYLS
jgi:hypothetical protein